MTQEKTWQGWRQIVETVYTLHSKNPSISMSNAYEHCAETVPDNPHLSHFHEVFDLLTKTIFIVSDRDNDNIDHLISEYTSASWRWYGRK